MLLYSEIDEKQVKLNILGGQIGLFMIECFVLHTSSRIPGHFVTTERWHLLCTTHVQTLNRIYIRLASYYECDLSTI